MLFSKGFVSARRSDHARSLFTLIVVVLCLVALVQTPAFATDPIDVDPNPDHGQNLYVGDLEQVDVDSLPPGRYVIIVTSENTSQRRYEIWVR